MDQNGLSKVDLLFVIDNSNSMASEQVKLAAQLPQLVNVLTSGDRYFERTPPAGITEKERFFTAVSSLHIGVVSSSMGGAEKSLGNNVALNDCLGFGDDGELLSSTEVAVNGVFDEKGAELIAPRPNCADVRTPSYQEYEAGGEQTVEELSESFSCVAQLGIEGCPFEQQLEAMWKALAPSNGRDPDLHVFLDDTKGHGDPDGSNEGFVRDDAILAVIQVSDEEDCSITQEGKLLFRNDAEANERFGTWGMSANLRCGENAGDETLIWSPQRYIDGLKSLKPDNPDRIIFAAIVGIPVDAIGEDLDEVLAREDMQFAANGLVPRVSCKSSAGDDAYPPRRFLEVAKGFVEHDNAVVHSICDDDYAPALEKLIERIAAKLTGNCLPRQLTPDENGEVRCEVFEMLAPGVTKCDPEHGHLGKPEPRELIEDKKKVIRQVCKMDQVPVFNKVQQEGKVGWYYDDFDPKLVEECDADKRQRISFTFGSLPGGGGAFIECFKNEARLDEFAVGVDAVNFRCAGDAECSAKNDKDYELFCSEDNTCQITCKANTQCPPGWVCGTKLGSGEGPEYCQLPTCPVEDTETASGAPDA